jgi:hypothetical protein
MKRVPRALLALFWLLMAFLNVIFIASNIERGMAGLLTVFSVLGAIFSLVLAVAVIREDI